MAKETPMQHVREQSSEKFIGDYKDNEHKRQNGDKDTDTSNANIDQMTSQKSIREENKQNEGRPEDHITRQNDRITLGDDTNINDASHQRQNNSNPM